jgi:outer membrane murein-binding lipoprotein Lpp
MNKKLAVSAFLVAITMPLSIVLADEAQPATPLATSTNTTTDNQWQQDQDVMQTQRDQNNQSMQTLRDQNKQTMEALKEKRQQDRCKNIGTRIDTRINRYQNGLKMFQNVFGNMQTRLTRLATRLQTALTTANVTDLSKLNQLNTDLGTLNTKIQKLNTDYAAFIATLSDAKTTTTTCDPTAVTTGLSGKFGEARKNVTLIQQDRLDIRNFFAKTIRPDLLAIRAQLPAKSETIEPAETTEEHDSSHKAMTTTSTTPTTTEKKAEDQDQQ